MDPHPNDHMKSARSVTYNFGQNSRLTYGNYHQNDDQPTYNDYSATTYERATTYKAFGSVSRTETNVAKTRRFAPAGMISDELCDRMNSLCQRLSAEEFQQARVILPVKVLLDSPVNREKTWKEWGKLAQSEVWLNSGVGVLVCVGRQLWGNQLACKHVDGLFDIFDKCRSTIKTLRQERWAQWLDWMPYDVQLQEFQSLVDEMQVQIRLGDRVVPIEQFDPIVYDLSSKLGLTITSQAQSMFLSFIVIVIGEIANAAKTELSSCLMPAMKARGALHKRYRFVDQFEKFRTMYDGFDDIAKEHTCQLFGTQRPLDLAQVKVRFLIEVRESGSLQPVKDMIERVRSDCILEEKGDVTLEFVCVDHSQPVFAGINIHGRNLVEIRDRFKASVNQIDSAFKSFNLKYAGLDNERETVTLALESRPHLISIARQYLRRQFFPYYRCQFQDGKEMCSTRFKSSPSSSCSDQNWCSIHKVDKEEIEKSDLQAVESFLEPMDIDE